ncbi:cold-shock dead-box protein a [hydrocarbon metagenome]|uniref:Cold-shock dead-box protein a n=1 Tax=hydrocarbon metagenome TaxID=938273 RepID=A0A0W8E890_9ZZZZ
MNNSFKNLGVSTPILKALEEMGFEAPTEVQRMAIPHILNQEDLIVMSKTGSGKTAVFGVSMLQLTDPGAVEPQGLILTPTRELAVQVDSDLKQMSKHLQHKTTAVYGQHNMNVEIDALNKGVSIVSGTPGRVFDHIRQRNLKTKSIRFLVLDEADRMLDMGFLDQVERIIKTLPRDRVTLLFSATIPSEVRKICREYMKHPVTVEIESPTMTVDTTQQAYYRVKNNEKSMQLNRLLLTEQPESCMIFCNTRNTVDRVHLFLSKKGYASAALHGDIPQVKRMKTLQQFKQGQFHLLVATDVAARGIHIDDLGLVINYDVPIEKDSYVHRIGRTGRAGNGGKAITLVTGEDIMSLYEIEEHIGAMIPEAELPSDALIHELRDSVEKWIQANSAQNNLSQASPGSHLLETQIKRSPTKPQQQNEKQRDRSLKVKSDKKIAPRTDMEHPAEPKLVRIIIRPAVPNDVEADVNRAKETPDIDRKQASTPRKTFLQRVLQHIWSR